MPRPVPLRARRSVRVITTAFALALGIAVAHASATVSPGATVGTAPAAPASPPPASSSPAAAKSREAQQRDLDELLELLRRRNADQYAIHTPHGIDVGEYVTLGGIEQWITIRGEDTANPVLLLLHGGPGDVTNIWSFGVLAPWEKVFTVVQWDQRGAGRTLAHNGSGIGPSLTLDRLTQDGIELAEHLCRRLGKRRLVLVGHSFGSTLGLRMAQARPDLFHAMVGTGQVGDNTRNYEVAYQELLKKARTDGNQRAIDELTQVGPPPYPDGKGYGVQRKWANAFEGADQFLAATIGYALVAPGGSIADLNDNGTGQMFSGERLVPQLRAAGSALLPTRIEVPFIVIQGEIDFTTPVPLARAYLDSIQAPAKTFVTIADAGHFAAFMRPKVFLRELVTHVLPLTAERQAAALP